MWRLSAIVFIHCLSCIELLPAQDHGSSLQHYSYADGMSVNTVTCIAQDEWGYIWVGTDNGLNRFDGYRFEKFYQDNPSYFLRSSHIYRLIPLPGHRLAVATRMGALILNTRDYSVKYYIVPDSTAFTVYSNSVWDIKEIGNGAIAMTTASGFYVFSNDGQIIFRKDAYKPGDAVNKRILYGRNMLSLPEDKVVVYINVNEQAIYDQQRNTFQEFTTDDPEYGVFAHPPGPGWITQAEVAEFEYVFSPCSDSLIYYDARRSLRRASPLPFHYEDEFHRGNQISMTDDSTMQISSHFGGFFLFRLDRKTGVISPLGSKRLAGSKVSCYFIDDQKQLWFGNEDGLFHDRPKAGWIRKYHLPVHVPEQPRLTIDSVDHSTYIAAVRHRDKLYLARHDIRYGLVIADRKTMKVEHVLSFFDKRSGHNLVFSMQMYHHDTLWLGTGAGLIWFDTRSHTYDIVRGDPRLSVIDLLGPEDREGRAWFGASMNGVAGEYDVRIKDLRFFDSASDPVIPFRNFKHLVFDSHGDVWLGGHGLARFNRRTQYFDTLITVYGGPNKYDDDIISMQADDDGALWIHNAGNGLLRYDVDAQKWRYFGSSEGIPSQTLETMSPVVDGKLWIATTNQLVRFNTRTFESDIFGSPDGFPDVPASSVSMYFDTIANELYLLSGNNVVVIPVDSAITDNTGSNLLFEQINLHDGRSIHFPRSGIVLPARHNNLLIPFTVIDFQHSSQYRFAYRLNGQKDWNDLGNRRSVDLIGLSPGKYRLQVKASPQKGNSFINTLEFSIRPPIWRSPFVLVGYAIAFLTLLYLLYKWRVSRIRERADLDKRLSQTEMKALHAQMNPHFVFNSLNSIREMILNEENMEASRYLANFAHLIRMTLHQSRQNTISLRETMDYLNRYVQMEQIRNAEFTFNMDVAENVDPDDSVLPPMLIQPFIENAIWHGRNGREGNIEITVRFDRQDDRLICTIEDNGVGINKSINSKPNDSPSHRSVSIANIRDRMMLLDQKHNLQSTLKIEDIGEMTGFRKTGTRVTLILPVEIHDV